MKKFFISVDFGSEVGDTHYGLMEYKSFGNYVEIGYSRNPKYLRRKALKLGMVEYSEVDYKKDLARIKQTRTCPKAGDEGSKLSCD